MKTTRCALMVSAVFSTALAAIASGQGIWKSHGPRDAGSVNDIAIADSVAYAATYNGVFRSHDRGETWQQSGLELESINQVVAQPGAPVVLALEGRTATLYASRDRGESWAPVSGLPGRDGDDGPEAIVGAAGIDPGQPSTIYVEADDTIWKSTDAGVSWRATSSKPGSFGRPRAFAFDSPAVYLLTEESLYKTLDGGVTWTSAQPTFGTPSAIAVSATAGTIYAIGQDFCRSADWAATWTCSLLLDTFSYYYAERMVEVPGDTPATTRLIAGSYRGIFVSRDRGATWARSSDVPDTRTALAYDAPGSFVLAGTDTQVFRSEDDGDTWTPFRSGLNAVVIGALALDPQNPSTIWAGGIGNGLFRSANSGYSWSPAGGLPGPGFVNALVIDPENPRTMYAASGGIYRTEDGGGAWTPSNAFAHYFLALDPADHLRIWKGSGAGINGGGSGLHYSDDGARTFRSVPSVTQTIYSILFDPRRPVSIYGGSYDRVSSSFGYPQAVGGSIFVSRDNGATFTKGATNFGDRVISMTADPFEDILYAATGSRGVFRSLDGGTTWEAAGDGLTALNLTKIVADPVRPGRLYAATDLGVYRSTDAARTWEHIGLSFTSGELIITPDGRWLYAGTSGGVFQLDLEAKPPSFPCKPSETRLCLVGNRYAVDLVAARKGEPTFEPGAARPLGDRAGYFGLPSITGNPDLPEVVVKMLADGTFGTAGAPFFYSSLTTVSYRLAVTDTMTGEETVYVNNPEQPLCGRTDLLFPEAEGMLSPRAGQVVGEETTLRLLGDRFSVTLEARRVRDGRTAPGVITASGDVYGIFSLPGITGDSTFPEVAVKMVDARSFANKKFWFFHTGLTSLEYTLTVTDSVTGGIQTYTNRTPFCGAADTRAFTDSPSNPSPTDLTGVWTGTLTYGTDFGGSCPSEPVQVRLADRCCWSEVSGSFQTHCMGKVYVNAWFGTTVHVLLGPRSTLDPQDSGVSRVLTGSVSSAVIDVSSGGGTRLSLSR